MKITTLAATLFATLVAAAAPTTRHFYTRDPGGEYAPSLGYGFRIQSWYAFRDPVDGTIPIYRCRNGAFDLSFLTTDGGCEGSGWQLEGIIGHLYRDIQPNTLQVVRLVNNMADHTYWSYGRQCAGDTDCFSGLHACDRGFYAQEGVLGYAPRSPQGFPGTVEQVYSFRKGCNNDRDTCCNECFPNC